MPAYATPRGASVLCAPEFEFAANTAVSVARRMRRSLAEAFAVATIAAPTFFCAFMRLCVVCSGFALCFARGTLRDMLRPAARYCFDMLAQVRRALSLRFRTRRSPPLSDLTRALMFSAQQVPSVPRRGLLLRVLPQRKKRHLRATLHYFEARRARYDGGAYARYASAFFEQRARSAPSARDAFQFCAMLYARFALLRRVFMPQPIVQQHFRLPTAAHIVGRVIICRRAR